jgi:TonB family protein
MCAKLSRLSRLGVLMRLLIASCLFVWPFAAMAQSSPAGSITIEPAIAAQHLKSSDAPNYPPIAKAAHVSGDVKLELNLDTTGHVVGTKVLSGPPMLVGAAIDCVKKWVYEPFESNGQPISVSTNVTVPFSLGITVDSNDEKIASTFFPLDDACHRTVAGNGDTAQQADACKKAADVAEEFSVSARFIERRSAFVYASTALRRNHQLQEALRYASKAVAVVEQGHDDGSGSSAAYGVKAQAEAELGDLPTADRDLTKAEDFERIAIENMSKMDLAFVQHAYIPTLRGLLRYHAQVLLATGNTAAAEAKTSEAEKL